MVWAWMRLWAQMLACSLLLPAAARAAIVCRAPLEVPIAALGQAVTVENGKVGGIYPDLLKGLGEGCIEYTVVPRARQQRLFDVGKADLLVPASRTPERDELGVFVPMTLGRVVLVSLAAPGAPARVAIRNEAALLERRELRVVVVRGYDFGPEYRQLTDALSVQGRLVQASDLGSLVRMLDEGMADVTLMNSSILLGAMMGDAKLRGMIARLHYESLPGQPWTESGVYVSKRSGLTDKELLAIVDQLEALARSGRVWAAYQKRFPPGSLNESMRPRFSIKEEGADAQR
jgi:polar amino acid transport system substrate-binding protein